MAICPTKQRAMQVATGWGFSAQVAKKGFVMSRWSTRITALCQGQDVIREITKN